MNIGRRVRTLISLIILGLVLLVSTGYRNNLSVVANAVASSLDGNQPSSFSIESPLLAADATEVSLINDQQSCSQAYSGKIAVTFTWQSSGAGEQWLDLSLYDNGFAPGTFAGWGPFAAGDSTATWDGLDSLTTFFARINTATPSGWKTSSTFSFRSGQCPAGHPFPVLSRYVSGKKIVLTFDDCADSGRISDILDVLRFFGAEAIFFPTGQCAQNNAALFEKAIAEGNLIGNHTYSHPHLTRLSDSEIVWQLQNGPPQALGSYWRPPFFEHNNRIDAIAASLGYTLMMWNIDSNDFSGTPASVMINKVISAARVGAIVSMHMQGPNTLAALPWIIVRLVNAGYVITW
jgi:peptidoglycan/xylan/chitin deacetylase (PgdA/CDA1 family)